MGTMTTTPLPPTATTTGATARIAQIVRETEAEGPGRRYAVWFQGCPLRCPGCCNPEFLKFGGGTETTAAEIVADFRKADVEGLSLLGGEPFAHADAGVVLARAAWEQGCSVMIYSGYTLAELRANPDPAVQELLGLTDVLVDGPYVREQPETKRRWVGSRNQQVHLFTEFYADDDPRWTLPNTLEIRLHDGELSINGFPARAASSLWKGWRRKPTRASLALPLVSDRSPS